MGSVFTLAGKELRQIFLSPIAYVFMVVFVFFVTFMFFREFFLIRQASMAGFFGWFPYVFAFVLPGVTMRMWAEERRQGTIEFLLTSPIETWQIVLAKYIAGLVLVTLCVLCTLLVPFTVGGYGDLDPGPVIGGYLGAILMGGACIAICMLLSAFTRDQIVALILGVFVLFTLVLLGHPYFSSEFGPGSWLGAFARVISPTTHFESIGRGVIDLRDIYYFVAITALFLYLNARVVDLRRWR